MFLDDAEGLATLLDRDGADGRHLAGQDRRAVTLADRIERERGLLDLGVGVAAAQLLLLCWFGLFFAVRHTAEQRRPDMGLLKLRGAARWRMWTLASRTERRAHPDRRRARRGRGRRVARLAAGDVGWPTRPGRRPSLSAVAALRRRWPAPARPPSPPTCGGMRAGSPTCSATCRPAAAAGGPTWSTCCSCSSPRPASTRRRPPGEPARPAASPCSRRPWSRSSSRWWPPALLTPLAGLVGAPRAAFRPGPGRARRHPALPPPRHPPGVRAPGRRRRTARHGRGWLGGLRERPRRTRRARAGRRPRAHRAGAQPRPPARRGARRRPGRARGDGRRARPGRLRRGRPRRRQRAARRGHDLARRRTGTRGRPAIAELLRPPSPAAGAGAGRPGDARRVGGRWRGHRPRPAPAADGGRRRADPAVRPGHRDPDGAHRPGRPAAAPRAAACWRSRLSPPTSAGVRSCRATAAA